MVDAVFSTVYTAKLEGRIESVQRRKREIQRLHHALKLNRSKLVIALQKDGYSAADALLEIHTTLWKLREVFHFLDFGKSLAAEQMIEQGRDNLHRSQPLGTVLVLNGNRLVVAQALVQAAYTIATGNTSVIVLPSADKWRATIIELQHLYERSKVDAEILQLVVPNSEADYKKSITALLECPFDAVVISDEQALDLTKQSDSHYASQERRLIHAISTAWPCIVTRNADIKQAARDISVAKFIVLSGQSLVSPSVVFVDEFILPEFRAALETAVGEASLAGHQLMSKSPTSFKKDKASSDAVQAFKALGGSITEVQGGDILVGKADWRYLDDYFPLKSFVNGGSQSPRARLLIVPVTSVEAAMSLGAQLIPPQGPSGWYYFCNMPESRYLTNISTEPTYVNGIPLSNHFLPLPFFPIEQVLNQYLKPSPIFNVRQDVSVNSSLFTFPSDLLITTLEAAIEGDTLKPPVQKSGFQVGFFEQGARMGLAHFLAVLLGTTGLGIWWIRSLWTANA